MTNLDISKSDIHNIGAIIVTPPKKAVGFTPKEPFLGLRSLLQSRLQNTWIVFLQGKPAPKNKTDHVYIQIIPGTSRERAQRPLRSGLSKAVKTWNQDGHVTRAYIAYIQTTFKATPLVWPVANLGPLSFCVLVRFSASTGPPLISLNCRRLSLHHCGSLSINQSCEGKCLTWRLKCTYGFNGHTFVIHSHVHMVSVNVSYRVFMHCTVYTPTLHDLAPHKM